MLVKVKNPLWEHRYLYFFHMKEYTVYEGERIPTPSWVEYSAICITANIPSKYRIIRLESVVSIDDEVVNKPVTQNTSDRVVRVNGSNGKEYLVTVQGKVKSCSCTGFSFRRTCKHLAAVA